MPAREGPRPVAEERHCRGYQGHADNERLDEYADRERHLIDLMTASGLITNAPKTMNMMSEASTPLSGNNSRQDSYCARKSAPQADPSGSGLDEV